MFLNLQFVRLLGRLTGIVSQWIKPIPLVGSSRALFTKFCQTTGTSPIAYGD